MWVRITHLKAPWPDGLGIGDTLDAGDVLSPAFNGKCEPCDPPAEFVVNPEGAGGDAGNGEEKTDPRAALQAELVGLGVTPDHRWGLTRLRAEVAKAQAAKAEAEAQ